MHTIELTYWDGDDNRGWLPGVLINAKTAFASSASGAKTREEAAQEVERLGLIDIETGVVDEFRTMDPGYQAGSGETDGRFLAWVEGGKIVEAPLSWRIYALDLATRDSWLVEADPGTAPRWMGPEISIDDGRLVYCTSILNAEDEINYQIKLVDLESKSSVVIPSGPLPLQPSLSGDTLIWLEQGIVAQDPNLQSMMTLYFRDISSGETRVLAQDYNLGSWPIIRDGKVLYAIGKYTERVVHLLDVETGEDKAISAPLEKMKVGEEQSSFTLVDGFAFWTERATYNAFVYDMQSGETRELDRPFAGGTQAVGNRLYWFWHARLDTGQLSETLYLKWVELPTP